MPTLNIGTPNGRDGDLLRDAFVKLIQILEDKTETGGYSGTAQDIVDLINNNVPNITIDTDLDINSDNPLENSKITEIFNQIFDVIAEAPDYIQPTVSIPSSINRTIEKGDSVSNVNADISFVQNDAGTAVSYSLEKNGVEISTTQNNNISETDILNTIEYIGKVTYQEGDTKQNNIGVDDPTGKILAGTTSSTVRRIIPRLKIFSGIGSVPTSSSEIRLGNDVFNNANNIDIVYDGTEVTGWIAIPVNDYDQNNITLIDETNLNNPTIYPDKTTVDLVLPNGDNEPYNIYSLTTNNPYTNGTTHRYDI